MFGLHHFLLPMGLSTYRNGLIDRNCSTDHRQRDRPLDCLETFLPVLQHVSTSTKEVISLAKFYYALSSLLCTRNINEVPALYYTKTAALPVSDTIPQTQRDFVSLRNPALPPTPLKSPLLVAVKSVACCAEHY